MDEGGGEGNEGECRKEGKAMDENSRPCGKGGKNDY